MAEHRREAFERSSTAFAGGGDRVRKPCRGGLDSFHRPVVTVRLGVRRQVGAPPARRALYRIQTGVPMGMRRASWLIERFGTRMQPWEGRPGIR